MNGLHDLARAAGLHIDWEDASGRAQRVGDEALLAILDALGLPAGSKVEIAESRQCLADDADIACRFVTADVGSPVALPGRCGEVGPAELILEDGTRHDIRARRMGSALILPAIQSIGYHRVVIGQCETNLAIAPRRCFQVQDAAPGRRIWGPAVQIASLRDDRGAEFGDFTALANAARAFGSRGADALAISPVHALFPADSSRYSPYAPSSRLFLNVLYADPALIGTPIPDQAQPDLIDWEHAIPERLRLLRQAYDLRGDRVRHAVETYRKEAGDELERHARFDALHAYFFGRDGARGWQGWPAPYHDPASAAVQRFASEHSKDIGFYLFMQWLAKHSLNEAQKAATQAGMAIGLITDLAVGTDGGGSQAWSRRDELLTGLSIGAPPDLLGPHGQNWGITGFSPQALRRTGFKSYLATLRAALEHAGGIRIDHALGLKRQWIVPDGASPDEGAYLTMPFDDMLRLLALESYRARAIVVGEDLGTVPYGFRPAMDEKGMLGMRVLWFERDGNGRVIPSERWPVDAAAMTGTHDLPTVAGWWSGHDIDWAWKLGRASGPVSKSAHLAQRAKERAVLWRTFEGAGAAQGQEPASGHPEAAVDAALRFIGSTPSVLALIPFEDIAGLAEQPNLPGTTDEHPNWRRRMPDTSDALLAREEVVTRIDDLNTVREQ